MKDYLVIGSAPYKEECVCISNNLYESKMLLECAAFIEAIRKKHGNEPSRAKLEIKRFCHDFGPYYEVVCCFDDTDRESMNYAFIVEDDSPATWAEVGMEAPFSNKTQSLSYENWINEVNTLVISQIGISLEDGSDWPSHDMWNSGANPFHGAQLFIHYQGL